MNQKNRKDEQNPHRCSDNSCVLLAKSRFRGQGTNSNYCKCLSHDFVSLKECQRIQAGILWLVNEISSLDAKIKALEKEKADEVVSGYRAAFLGDD